jgi:lambda repressor-like predicted transcriptional regulator
MGKYEDPAERRRREYLKKTGRGYTMERDEIQPALDRVRELHGRGMSTNAMSKQCGLSQSGLSELVKGFRYRNGKLVPVNRMTRKNFNAVMTLRYEEPPTKPRGKPGGYSGARTPCHAQRRKVQALMAAGLSLGIMSEESGLAKAWLGRFAKGRSGIFSHSGTITVIDRLYDKLKDCDPVDLGMLPSSVKKNRSIASTNGYAPSHCWDDDPPEELADGEFSHYWGDEDAIPEWTGACATIEGYYLHIKYKMLPACRPCAKAKTAYNRAQKNGATDNVAEARAQDVRNLIQLGHSHESIMDITGVCLRTVERAVRKMEQEQA